MAGQWMAAALLAAGLMGTAVEARTQDDRRIAKLAAEAESQEQHTRVADAYRDRAELLEAEAAREARKARRLEAAWFPHEHKLPPMQRPGYRERQRAASARTEAREARVLAQKHTQIATDLRNAP